VVEIIEELVMVLPDGNEKDKIVTRRAHVHGRPKVE
jgi:hypothetical protein